MNLKKFFYVFQNAGFEKNWGYNREIVSSITRKIFVCDMKSWYKNIPKTQK